MPDSSNDATSHSVPIASSSAVAEKPKELLGAKRLRWLSLGLLGLAFFNSVIAFLGGQLDQGREFTATYLGGLLEDGRVFNSDVLHLPIVFQDSWRGHASLVDWWFTPGSAPAMSFYVPDGVIAGFASIFTSSIYIQLLLSGLINFFVLFLALRWIARAVLPNDATTFAALGTSSVTLAAILGGHPFDFIFIQAHHWGSFSMGLLLLGMVLANESENTPSRLGLRWLGVVAFTAACIVGDPLFLANSLAPVVGALVLAWLLLWRKPRLIALIGVPALLLTTVLPSLYAKALANDDYIVQHVSISELVPRLQEVAAYFTALASEQPLWGFLALAFVLGTVALFPALVLRARQEIDPLARPMLQVSLFALMSISIPLAGYCISSRWFHARYFSSTIHWPIFGTALLAAYIWGKRALKPIALAVVVATAPQLISSMKTIADGKVRSQFTTPDLTCIDNALDGTDATRGISGFWTAKFTQAFSRHKLTMTQFRGSREYHWIQPMPYFMKEYDFAIVSPEGFGSGPNPLGGIVANGPRPNRIVSCGKYTLLLYPHRGLRIP